MKVKLWIEKNMIFVTFAIAIVTAICLIWKWSDLTWLQRFALMLYDVLALHELEEMLNGFAEKTLGEQNNVEKKVGLGQLYLFCVSIYMPLISVLFPESAWLLVSYLILGMIELPAHIFTLMKGYV